MQASESLENRGLRAEVFSVGVSLSNRALLTAAALVFLASNAVGAAGFAFPAAIAILFGCCGVAFLLLSARARGTSPLLDAAIDVKLLALCGCIAVTLCLLGGETHQFWADNDWLTRDAVLADAVRHVVPVFYKAGDETYILRAPLGMYMIPGLVGHAFGLFAGHVALLVQNAFLLTVVLYLAAALGAGFPMAVFLVLFGGMDVLPWSSHAMKEWALTGQLSIDGPLQWWAKLFQYSAHVTQIFLVPNHALPGWFFAVMAILAARREIDLGLLGAIFAALIFWSPLGPLAALPILAWFAWRDRAELLASPRPALGVATAACFLPVALYLVTDAAAIAHSAMWRTPGFWSIYFLFIAVEIPHAAFVFALWPRVRAELKPLVIIAVTILLLLPIYSFGPANDFVMRASIAPLFLLAFAFLSTLLDLDAGHRLAAVAGGAIVAVGSGVALLGVTFVLLLPRYEISACNLVTATSQQKTGELPLHYLARVGRAPGWLLPAPGAAENFETVAAAPCWPDHPIHNGKPPAKADAGAGAQ